MRKLLIILFFALLIIAFSNSVLASPVTIDEDFSSDNPNFTYNGVAHRDSFTEEGLLSVVCCGYRGSIFYNEPINTAQFNAEFDFRIEKLDPAGADGFTFAFIKNGSPTYLGNGGGDLGYVPRRGSLPIEGFAIEFDVHNNYGPDQFSDNHIGVDVNGDRNSVYLNSNIPILEDNGTFHVEIKIRGGKHIEVVLENESINYPKTKVVDYTIKDMKPFKGVVGFTGGVGAFRDLFFIDNFRLQHQPL